MPALPFDVDAHRFLIMSTIQKFGYSCCAALLALLVFYKSGPWLKWPKQGKSRRIERQILRLSQLPPEILVEIVKHIEWNDVLSVRRCCRTLHSVSKDREVWLSLLRRYCDTVIPRPFFLSKPVELCSGDDLEARVVQWWTGWGGLQSTVQTFTADDSIPDIWGPLCPLPGDRYFLYKTKDGSIYYCNPGQPDSPMHLLLPSPYPKDPCVSVCVAIDVIGTQNIDPASSLPSASSFEHRLFPPVFRLAAIRRSTVEIWEIRPEVQGETIVYSARLLKSFVDNIRTTCCSLLGDHVAYGLRSLGRTKIVDWTAVADERPVVGAQIALSSPLYILLLPRGRILVHSSYIHIADWNACRQLDSSPIRPQWKSTDEFRRLHPYSHPFYIDNSFRLLGCSRAGRALTGVIIKDSDVSVSDSVAIAKLAESTCPAPLL
ncbi:hypothetical protein CC1G_14937 [Coprinopsis cinerea okayama7|uniref:F-box domain-containing protein n=1 Tax=Coprinopsis cinerea (strain Okayama-7 / 130 / ATCC MYA-4618 / FGSC 9003) TaxID=240176 RepID=D6RP00_COPC7|nr:hypothetical protein CC1G_14937 [Coprinopsis cinerea okayama7\|eukprot:XP_002910606.1 hypothetical protein CC1G_14937 [Coprinopsis cinerea okayama7\